MTKTYMAYIGAALAEIAGCYGFWLWLREARSPWLVPLSLVSLAVFAWLLTMVDVAAAGRAYAAYGGIYIVASLCWLWQVDGIRPDKWDLAGGALCLLGAAVILWAPRSTLA